MNANNKKEVPVFLKVLIILGLLVVILDFSHSIIKSKPEETPKTNQKPENAPVKEKPQNSEAAIYYGACKGFVYNKYKQSYRFSDNFDAKKLAANKYEISAYYVSRTGVNRNFQCSVDNTKSKLSVVKFQEF